MRAAQEGQTEVVNLLSEKGARVTDAVLSGWTPLHLAAYKVHLEVVGSLLEKEAIVTAVGKNGWSAVNLAADSGHIHVVELLLEKGAGLSVANADGWTPLHCAASNNHLDVVKLLLDKGAYEAEGGMNSMHGTIANLFAFKGYIDLLRFILEHHNAGLHGADSHERNSPHFAVRGGHMDTLQYVMSQGLELTSPNTKGNNLACLAASSASLDVLNAILERGSELVVASEYWSALHCPVGLDQSKMLRHPCCEDGKATVSELTR